MGAVFLKCLFCKKYHVTRIYTPRTYKNAFTAKHALVNFLCQSDDFPTANEQVHLPDIKIDQGPGIAGCCASAAREACPERRLFLKDLVQQPAVELSKVDCTRGHDLISESIHPVML